MEDVGRWACGRPEPGGGMQNLDSDADDDVFTEELSLERLNGPGAKSGCTALICTHPIPWILISKI